MRPLRVYLPAAQSSHKNCCGKNTENIPQSLQKVKTQFSLAGKRVSHSTTLFDRQKALVSTLVFLYTVE